MTGPSVHASAVQVGDAAVLIRGPSGSGKSRLAFALIMAGRARQIPATLLIGDDRVDLSSEGGRLVVHRVPALAGLIEVRGLGIRRCDHAVRAPVTLVVDLDAADAARMPAADALSVTIDGVAIARIPVATGSDALPLVLAALTTGPADCRQDVGNHIEVTLAETLPPESPVNFATK